MSGKACAARLREGGRHAVIKFRRAVRVKITIKNRERGNLAFKRFFFFSHKRKELKGIKKRKKKKKPLLAAPTNTKRVVR